MNFVVLCYKFMPSYYSLVSQGQFMGQFQSGHKLKQNNSGENHGQGEQTKCAIAVEFNFLTSHVTLKRLILENAVIIIVLHYCLYKFKWSFLLPVTC